MNEVKNYELLCQAVESVVGRKMRTPKDFDQLSQLIFEQQHQNVSATTLKRLWGYLPAALSRRNNSLWDEDEY